LQLKNVREQLGDAALEKCLAGFYFSESATTRFYALILPRNEKGLKEVCSGNGRKLIYRRAQYFRVVRPATGVSLGDISFDVSVGWGCACNASRARHQLWCAIFRVVQPATGVRPGGTFLVECVQGALVERWWLIAQCIA
jgi:hypothetical protein